MLELASCVLELWFSFEEVFAARAFRELDTLGILKSLHSRFLLRHTQPTPQVFITSSHVYFRNMRVFTCSVRCFLCWCYGGRHLSVQLPVAWEFVCYLCLCSGAWGGVSVPFSIATKVFLVCFSESHTSTACASRHFGDLVRLVL